MKVLLFCVFSIFILLSCEESSITVPPPPPAEGHAVIESGVWAAKFVGDTNMAVIIVDDNMRLYSVHSLVKDICPQEVSEVKKFSSIRTRDTTDVEQLKKLFTETSYISISELDKDQGGDVCCENLAHSVCAYKGTGTLTANLFPWDLYEVTSDSVYLPKYSGDTFTVTANGTVTELSTKKSIEYSATAGLYLNLYDRDQEFLDTKIINPVNGEDHKP